MISLRMVPALPGLPALLPVLLGACADLTAGVRRPAPHEVVITTTEFSFRAPDTIPAGLTRIRLFNKGSEPHHVQLARLDDGRTIGELRDSLTAKAALPSWVTFVGGPNDPAPGAPSEVIVSLVPGSYAMLCFIPSADGVPHLAKGMIRDLVVAPAPPIGTQPEPHADARLALDDFGFELTPGLRAGRRTVRVENIGPQPHEVVLARLSPGKTLADALSWLEHRKGPMPGEPYGGTVALQAGQVNFVTADFPRGEYILLCFVPDSGDGRPHVAHGMIRQISVE
jgi:hypothetical protein